MNAQAQATEQILAGATTRLGRAMQLDAALRVNHWYLWIGLLVYISLGAVDHPEFISRAKLTYLVAPLVTIPLGLRLFVRGMPLSGKQTAGLAGLAATLLKLAMLAQFPLALLSIPAVLMLPETPKLAIPCAIAWAGWTGIAAGAGALRLAALGVRNRPLSEIAFDLGLTYLAVGGAWLVFWACGMQPLGLDANLVFFTAVHFHFAGIAVPFMAGLLGRWLRSSAESDSARFPLWSLATLASVAGVPLVAVGITARSFGVHDGIELICAAPLIAGLWTLALITLFKAIPCVRPIGASLLLGLSALASIAAMLLAGLFGYGLMRGRAVELFEGTWVSIPLMADWHGTFNAFLYVLFGLLGWLLVMRSAARREREAAEAPADE